MASLQIIAKELKRHIVVSTKQNLAYLKAKDWLKVIKTEANLDTLERVYLMVNQELLKPINKPITHIVKDSMFSEEYRIRRAVEMCSTTKEAYTLLEIGERTFYRKLAKYKIKTNFTNS